MSNTGGPAYPTSNYEAMVPLSTGYSEGMTLRDYFAAKAMGGFCADPNMIGIEHTAELAYRVADAMLAAREQK